MSVSEFYKGMLLGIVLMTITVIIILHFTPNC